MTGRAVSRGGDSGLRIIVAAAGVGSEAGLVSAAVKAGIQVVRRPVDAADLLAAATMEPSITIVIGADLPRLSLDVIDRLDSDQRCVIGIVDGPNQEARLRAFGVTNIVECQADPADTIANIAALLTPRAEAKVPVQASSRDSEVWEEIIPTGQGQLIAVWGPAGAPGRSALALEVSGELARKRQRTCTVDADTYAPALAMRLGVIDDISGLIVACRHADNGSLATRTLLSATRLIDDRWYLLTGIGRSERWPDLRPAALERLWATCRATFDTTIIDVGACIESSSTVSLPGLTMERNAAARSALMRADGVLVVTRPDALSVTRLISGLPQIREIVGDVPIRVVLTQVERRDRRPASVRDLLLRAGVSVPIDEVALDARAYGRALDRGTTIRQVAPTSRSRRGVQALAQAMIAGWPGDFGKGAPAQPFVAA